MSPPFLIVRRLSLSCCFLGADLWYLVPLVTPTSSPILPSPPTQELVLFVGYPCLGKTSFYRRYFQPGDYVHINQDTLKTRDKCVKAAREVFREGKSCVIGEAPLYLSIAILSQTDNTNRDASTRKYYINIAKEHGISIRCVVHTSFMYYFFSKLL
jgi:bifunctional polynucleotide phosphatase/kinase